MVTAGNRREALVRTFGSAIAVQAFLSAMNFVVGLILIRKTTNSDYGYFVLVSIGTSLLTGLQIAFIQPPLVIRMTKSSRSERADLIGGVYRGQRRILASLATAAIVLVATLSATGLVGHELGLLAIAAVAAFVSALYREFFRLVLFSYRRSYDVLKSDVCYGAIVLLGVPLAILSPAPAAGAILAVALAAIVGGYLLSRSLWRYEAWNPDGPASMLREMAPLGKWSALGSAAHWAFSQGYNYVVAGTLDVASVAALAATRLLMMPVNLLSAGITSLMMATSSAWLSAHGPAKLFRRLLLIASGLSVLALGYFVMVWLLRDVIFTHLMHKQFSQSGILVAEWSAVFLIIVFRDQLNFFPGASGLHRRLMGVTSTAAIISLGVGYLAIRRHGVVGAPFGVLVGELCNVVGILYLSLTEIRRHRNSS
jgi:O-antigen/teichoic acid export membrane protein